MISKGALEQGGRWVDQIFTLNQIGEKAQEKNSECMQVYVEKEHNKVNTEALWQVLWG